MLNDILNVVESLPSQHVIFGTISLVLCLAATWVYGNSSQNVKLIILQTIGYLVIFNEIAFQVYMVYYGIWSLSTSLPLEMCYLNNIFIMISLMKNIFHPYLHFSSIFCGLCGLINHNLVDYDIVTYLHFIISHSVLILYFHILHEIQIYMRLDRLILN